MALDEESPLVDNPTQSVNQTLNHGRDIHILSWAFLLIFLAYGAARNLQSTLNTDGDLGTISLGILYTSFTVSSLFASSVVRKFGTKNALLSSLFASSVVRKFGTKNALLLSTTGYWLYIAANLKPSWYTLVPASLYLGFAAAILWVAEGTYLTSTARSQANDHKLHEGTVIGHFNGEFWGIFACYQVAGNLLTLALLKDGTPSLGESGVGGAMAVYGAFDAICSLAVGRFTSGLASITFVVSGGAFLQGGILIWLLNYSEPTGVYRILYPLLIAAILGIGNSVLMTQLNALLAMLFKHNMEGTFAQLKLWQCASIAAVFFLSPYISLQTMLFLMLSVLVFSLAGFLFLVLKVEKVFFNYT